MKWIWLMAAALALLVALVALAGAMLPRAHHATRKARYRHPPAAIYGVLIGPPDWRLAFVFSRHDSGLLTDMKHGESPHSTH